ncbi:MAG: hypothetical protein ABSH51_01730 [Solirubrobacteraceae bacterium]|jgi:hypothetical protein
MNFKALDRGEFVAIVGGILLGVSLLMNWYTLGNRNTILGSCRGPNSTCSGWAALSALRFLLLLAAIAPLILAYIILRGHALSWPRGELTALAALVALTVTLFEGLIDRPGSPSGEIGVSTGWWVALAADVMILSGSLRRSHEGGVPRKPPGVL